MDLRLAAASSAIFVQFLSGRRDYSGRCVRPRPATAITGRSRILEHGRPYEPGFFRVITAGN